MWEITETSTHDDINCLVFWNDFLSSNFTSSYLEFIEKDKFRCRAEIASIQDIKVICGSGSAHKVYRMIKRNDYDSGVYTININLSGTISIIQENQEIKLKPQEFTFLDQDKNYSIYHEGDYQMLTIEVPKYILTERLRKPNLYLGLKLNGSKGFPQIAYQFFEKLPQMIKGISSKDVTLLKDSLINIIVNAFKSMDEWNQLTTVALGHLQRAKDIIAINLHEPDLSRAQVSENSGVSIRELNRIFSSEGTSITRYIKQQRLILAAKLLLDPLFQKVTVSEIAYRSGFSDLSHFSNSFSAKYNSYPKEYRQVNLKKI